MKDSRDTVTPKEWWDYWYGMYRSGYIRSYFDLRLLFHQYLTRALEGK